MSPHNAPPPSSPTIVAALTCLVASVLALRVVIAGIVLAAVLRYAGLRAATAVVALIAFVLIGTIGLRVDRPPAPHPPAIERSAR